MNIGNLDVGINVNTQGLTDGLKSAGEKVSNTNKLFGGFVITLQDVQDIAGKVAKALWSTIEAAAEQELVINQLTNAMKAQGIYTKEALDTNLAYANSLAQTTKYSDEEIVSVMKLLTNFGLHDTQLRKVTASTLDLATRTGSLDTAAVMLGKAFQGETGRLTQVGIQIDDTIPKSKKFEEVMRQVRDSYGGTAAGEAKTFSGSMAQLKNEFGELAEVIGGPFIASLTEANKNLKITTTSLKDELPKAIEATKGAFNQLFNSVGITTYIDLIKRLANVSTGTAKVIEQNTDDIGLAERKLMDEKINNWQIERRETQKLSNTEKNLAKEKEQEGQKTNERLLKIEMDTLSSKEKSAKQSHKNMMRLLNDEVNEHVKSAAKKVELAAKTRAGQTAAVNAFGNVLSNFQAFESQQIQNNLTEKINANNSDYANKKLTIDQKYAADISAVENSKMSEKEKADAISKINKNYNEAINVLETERSDNEKEFRDKAIQDEAKARREMKPFLIAQAVANTALGATNAFAQYGWPYGLIAAGIIAAAGAVEIATIEAQKFASGVRNFAGGWAVVGDVAGQGGELMNLPAGTDVYSNKESKKMLGGSQRNNFNISINAVVRSDEDWDKVTRNKIIPSLERYMKKTYESPFA